MARRRRAERREINPDAKYGDLVLAKFMNCLMYEGKKSVAENIVYGAFDVIQSKTRQEPLQVFHEALRNVSPAIEVKSRRVGGATYQVPVEVRQDRSRALAIRWLITAARGRNASLASSGGERAHDAKIADPPDLTATSSCCHVRRAGA